MKSMTGFGQARGENERFRIRATCRSVNHRFLDLSLRVDDPARGSEGALRELVAARLRRGRVELRMRIEELRVGVPEVRIRREAVAAVRSAVEEAGLDGDGVGFSELVRLPGIVEVHYPEEEWRPVDEELLLEVAGSALDEMEQARAEEGRRLAAILGEAAEQLSERTVRVTSLREEAQQELHRRVEEQVRELLGGSELDEGRLLQEVAFFVERSDIREELDRLGAHVDQLRELLDRPDTSGKRLDFLAQEMLREVNTVGSKAKQLEIVRAVLDAKMLCEQLREQLQNVE